ncbi:MAG: hypothetical protein KUG71_08580 [Porticoccaceae bacterium]|nr:hypothetical protein [Porticoccaceae bacterium]
MINRLAVNAGFQYQKGAGLIVLILLMVVTISTILLTNLAGRHKNTLQERQKTQFALMGIREALIGYAMANGRLPCPDVVASADGVQDLTGTSCSSAEGLVPWVDLGVGEFDAWGHGYNYRVTADFADTIDGTLCGVPVSGVSFELCSFGDITIRDAIGAIIDSLIPATVTSQGKNWVLIPPGPLPAVPDERENVDNDTDFVSRAQSTGVAGFDDQVVWLPLAILIGRMQDANKL